MSCLGAPGSHQLKESLPRRQPHMARMAVQFCLCNSRALRSQKGKALPSNPGSPLQVQSSLWATNISQVLRCYVAPLCRLLHSPPGANICISHSLDSRAVVAREITGRNLPLKSRVIEVGSKPIYCKADLLTARTKSTGPTWVCLSDPLAHNSR